MRKEDILLRKPSKNPDSKINWETESAAKFICSLTLCWPNGKSYTSRGIIKGRISEFKKGNKGFGYDPIFIPDGYTQTFCEMDPKLKISMDKVTNRSEKIKNLDLEKLPKK